MSLRECTGLHQVAPWQHKKDVVVSYLGPCRVDDVIRRAPHTSRCGDPGGGWVLATILSGALILLAALMLSVGGLAVVYRFVPVPLLQAHYGATGAIYAALYVMFGISLGFS